MSSIKQPPEIDFKHLVPPYKTYPFFTFGDETKNIVNVNDARHGLGKGKGKEFRLADAWWLAEAATLVYDDPLKVVPDTFKAAGFEEVKFIEDPKTDTQLFVASNRDHAVVACRGTESGMRPGERDFSHIYIDIMLDAQFRRAALDDKDARKGMVHAGFKKSADGVWGELSKYLLSLRGGGRKVWFTGHSLGAALATVAAARTAELDGFDLQGFYTCGSPRVGDEAFKKYFDGLFRDRFKMNYYRFVHQQDIVTNVPPTTFGYTHVGTMKYIDRDGKIHDGVGALEQAKNLMAGLLRRSFDVFGSINQRVALLIPEQLKHHVPTFYTSYLWNAHVKNEVK